MMQVTALFYHTWFHVQYSNWCEIVFDRGDTMNAVSFRFSTTSSMYGVVSYILIYREDMHNTLVLRNWMPIIISLLPKNAWFIEKCCTSGALGWRRGKSGGDIHLISPNHWSPSHVSIWHFDILREIRGKFPCGIILGDSIGKRGGNIHRDTCNSPLFPLNFCREISTRMIPWNSPWICVKIWGTWMLGIYLTN